MIWVVQNEMIRRRCAFQIEELERIKKKKENRNVNHEGLDD